MALVQACFEGRQKDVPGLLAADHNINEFDSRGFSPLIAAAHCGNYRLVKFLIRHGAAVDLANPDTGQTALHHAAKEGYPDVVKLLIKKYGADIKKKDVIGRNSVHWATVGGNVDIVQRLLRLKAPFDMADASGYTPFMTAVELDRTEVAEALLEAGASPKTQNNLKHNALEIADWYGHKQLVKTLSKVYKADNNQDEEDGGGGAGAGAGTGAGAGAGASSTSAAAPKPAAATNASTTDTAMDGSAAS